MRDLSDIQDFGSFVRAGKETQVFARDPSKERKKQRGAESPQRSPCYRANWSHRLTKGRCYEPEKSRAYPGSQSRQVGSRI